MCAPPSSRDAAVCSSISSSTRRWVRGWAASCMRWPSPPSRSEKRNPVTMSDENPVFERIRSDIAANPVVLFMKGTPVFPQCGFSALVVQVLSHMGVKFKGIDVLSDPEIRQGIKEFSNWPTIPQLYVRGELVGGADIIREMYQTGEFEQMLHDKGIAHSHQH